MTLKPKVRREIWLVIGQTGTGKSQWTKAFLRTQKRVIILDPQGEYDSYEEYANTPDLMGAVKDKKLFRVRCCDPSEFPDLCFAVRCIPDTLFVVEESQRVLAPRLKIPSEFEDIVYRGRHTGTSLLLIAQRATTVDIAVRSQFTQLVAFRQSEPNDLKWIEDVSTEEIADNVKGLEVLEYYHFSNTGIERKKLTKFY